MTDYTSMLDLRMTTDQAKAIYWIIGNILTNEVAKDLGLLPVFDALRDKYNASEIVGLDFNEWGGAVGRRDRDIPAHIVSHSNPWDVPLVDVTGITD